MLPDKFVYVVGTFDTKGKELDFVADVIHSWELPVKRVDLSTSGKKSDAEIPAEEVAAFHPQGREAVRTGDRGTSVSAMADAFERFVVGRNDIAGMIGLGGSGGTALITPAMRAIPIGVPKVMLSTVASGNIAPYVGSSDISMMYSVTDVAGINRVSQVIFQNAANALAGMVLKASTIKDVGKPAIGLTMFGVTTPCVDQVVAKLEADFDCLVFHATGTGGASMEKLADSKLIHAVVDITTTEVCDLLFDGVLAATEDRLGAIARTRVPYVGSCGALDMVNFGAMETVPERYKSRNLYAHNRQVTLMRTSPGENAEIGKWIGTKLNQCEGEVRFLIPEGGVSLIDAPGQPFYDPDADAALFEALEATLIRTKKRHLIRVPASINDPQFVDALVANFRSIARGVGQ